MSEYFATFVPGFKQLVMQKAQKNIKGFQLKQLLESGMYFSCNEKIQDLNVKRYFINVFLCVRFLKIKKNQSIISTLNKITKKSEIAKYLDKILKDYSSRSFRFMILKGSKVIHIPRSFRNEFVKYITSNSNFKYNPLRANGEIWILIRDEGCAVLGIKIPKKDRSANLKRGELNPHLAYILNLLSEPDKNDVYLDPFAGYGALPHDRLLMPYKHIFISDVNKKLVKELKNRFKHIKDVTVTQSDALYIKHIRDRSVNKIVMDPPWGIFSNRDQDYDLFYSQVLSELSRLTIKGGIIVILTARLNELESAVRNLKRFHILKKYSTLVNGKKATAYKIRKD